MRVLVENLQVQSKIGIESFERVDGYLLSVDLEFEVADEAGLDETLDGTVDYALAALSANQFLSTAEYATLERATWDLGIRLLEQFPAAFWVRIKALKVVPQLMAQVRGVGVERLVRRGDEQRVAARPMPRPRSDPKSELRPDRRLVDEGFVAGSHETLGETNLPIRRDPPGTIEPIMAVSAQDVKRLRDDTDAPMGECKAALEEAGGDFERAKAILREKGKAAAGKRAGRATGEGIAKFALSPDKKTAAGIVLECETDFVANNEKFKELADTLVNAFVTTDPGSDPNAVVVNGKPVATLLEEAVAVIRENIKLVKAIQIKSDGVVGIYNHHNGKKAAAVLMSGEGDNVSEAGNNLAMQTVALGAQYVDVEAVPKEILDKEYEIAMQRTQAEQSGKPQNVLENIAKGRVNKEFMQTQVLMEQPFAKDPSKTVKQYVEETAKGSKPTKVISLAVGADVSAE
ncbi:MAG: translation elongation factor Ts [Armatimonadetes bacterium]|nr:translation elongation factor Ts [Armatimonadota bacterium]